VFESAFKVDELPDQAVKLLMRLVAVLKREQLIKLAGGIHIR